MGWKASNKRIKYKLWNIKLYCSPKWSQPLLNFGWENSINRRRPSSLFHTTAQVKCVVFWGRVQLHNISEKFAYRTEEDSFSGFLSLESFSIFSLSSSLYSDLRIIIYKRRVMGFLAFGFPTWKILVLVFCAFLIF